MRFTPARTLLLTLALGSLPLGVGTASGAFLFSQPSYAMEIAASPPASLQGTNWYIASWSESLPLGPQPLTLTFDDDRLGGSGGCNNFRGGFQTEGDKLSIGDALASTRKACAPEVMAQEDLFLQILPHVQSYKITANAQLELVYRHNGKMGKMSFIPASQFSRLHNTHWQLLTMAGGSPIANDGAKEMPNIQFSGHRLAGSGGCNRLMGEFKVDGDRLSIDDRMATTMMACSEPLMNQEQSFLKALRAARTYQFVAPGNLVIDYELNGETQQLVFTPVRQVAKDGDRMGESPQAVEKTIYVAPSPAACTGLAPRTCLKIKEGFPNQAWKLHYDPIQGFDYEPGYYYRLKVRETIAPNPPADASSRRWTLISVESKSPQ